MSKSDEGKKLLIKLLTSPEPGQEKDVANHVDYINRKMVARMLDYIDQLNEENERLESKLRLANFQIKDLEELCSQKKS
jgi:hypothetical protein